MRHTVARSLGQRIGRQAQEAVAMAERQALLERTVLLLVDLALDEQKPKDVEDLLRGLREAISAHDAHVVPDAPVPTGVEVEPDDDAVHREDDAALDPGSPG